MVTFDVTVDSPISYTQLVNTAQTYSDTFGPVEGSVTDQVGFAELGISKFVTDATPTPGQIIEYILVLTNNGPSDATGVIVEDVLPPNPPMQYNSTSNGNYSVLTDDWTVDYLAAGASTSLYINMTIHLDTEDLLVTNVAEITHSDQYDPVTNNNISSVTLHGGMIGDTVWNDANENGVQDIGEIRLSGVGVMLYNAASNLLFTTTTDASGEYRFEGLDAGDYFLEFVPFTGWTVTTNDAGTSDFTDSDVNTNTFTTGTITLSAGEANLSIDMGLIAPTDPTDIGITKSVSDSTPMEGQSVEFTLVAINNGASSAPTVQITDALPSGLTYLSDNGGGSYSTVSNVWNIGAMAVGNSSSLVIAATVDELTEGNTIVNTALVSRVGATDTNAANDSATATLTVQTPSANPTNRIEGTVFFDANEDAFLDGGDSGTSGVTVNLYRDENGDGLVDAGDTWLTNQLTDVIGGYSFITTNTGVFVLNVDTNTLPLDSTWTTDNVETADFGTGTGLTESGNDFGYTRAADLAITKTVSPTGSVTNNQVLQYTITVSNLSDVVQTDIVINDPIPTGATYVPGSVLVTAPQVFGSNTVADSFPAQAYTNNTGTVDWSTSWVETGDDAVASSGQIQVAGGLIQFMNSPDLNDSIHREVDLSGATNAVLTLDWSTVALEEEAQVQISSNGIDFVNLLSVGSNAGTGTDVSDTLTANITAYISSNTTVRFISVNGSPWSNPAEYARFDNVQISFAGLLGIAGSPPIVASGYTLPVGSNLVVTFDVTVNDPAGVDSVVNTASVTSDQQVSPLTASTTNPVLGTVTGHLYLDTNGNGTQDGGEPDLANVDVVITDSLGGTQTVTTDSNGDYSATVPAGDTITDIDESDPDYPLGFLHTEGTDPTTTTAVGGATTFAENDGFYRGGVIGDLVWFDEDGDGIQEASDTNRIANLTVLLFDTNDLQVASTTTDSDGLYRFENLYPGDYRVSFDLTVISTNVGVVVANAGGNDALDSDVISGNTGGLADTDFFTLGAGETNLTLDLGLARISSTRAEVAEVWGEWADGVAYVVWETSSEWNTAGFFVYRIDAETGEEVRLNAKLLPASFFTPGGTLYRVEDFQALENQQGTYRLEEREMTGGTLDLGVHSVTFKEKVEMLKTEKLKEEVSAFQDVRISNFLPIALADEPAPEPSDVLKVLLQTDGMVGVSLQTIADGMGRTLLDVQSLVSSNQLRVTAQGNTIPIYFDSDQDRILFFGQGSTNWYTPDAAYLISEGDSVWMTQRAADAVAAPSVFPTTLRFEEDVYPFDNVLTRLDDYHYWKYILSDHATFGQQDFPLDLSGHERGDVELTVRLRGWSSSSFDPDHLAEFFFNGTNHPIGSVTFDDANVAEERLVVPEAFVQSGANTLTVKGTLQPGQVNSYFVLNWIDATFERSMVPQSDAAAFRATEASQMSAREFVEPAAMALNDQQIPVWIEMGTGEGSSKGWNVDGDDRLFDVEEMGNIPMVGTVPATADSWLLSETNQVDYLVVSSRALASTAQELADYRSSQGLRTRVAIFEELCDLFADGYRTPEAIPELLRYAQTTWAKSPWMVVLAGNGSYDYLGTFNEVNHLPPLLFETLDGLFAADGLLTDLDGDGLSDIAIGRLPALTSADLVAMIEKIKTYENQFGSAWQNELVLAADTSDNAGDFSAVNAAFEALAEPNYPVENIDLNTTATPDARERLLTRFDTGAGIIHYTGHGGVNNLSAQSLLTSSDVSSMTNASTPPVVIALSCLIGRYEAPLGNGLGETLMRKSGGGAVAVWSPSGLSMNTPASALGDAFYQDLLVDGDGTLGLAVLQAHRNLATTPSARDTVAVYNLLGDPALRLAGNTQSPQPKATYEQWRWQVFTPQELTNATFSAQSADPNGNGQNNLIEYAFGGDPASGGETFQTLESGPVVIQRGKWAIIRWAQRQQVADIQYRLSTSSDLVEWDVSPVDLKILSTVPSSDGVMEEVTGRLPFPGSKLYIKLDVIQK